MRAAIIPALDEEATIARVVGAVRRQGVDEVIVVDNGSADGTRCRAEAAGARVVLESRRGYGAACLAGIGALPPHVSTVVFLDGDGSDDTDALGELLDLVERGEADLAIGSRMAAAAGGLTPAQKLGNRLAGWLLGVFYGAPSTDLGPMRVIRADVLRSLGMRDRGFGWTVEMQARAALMGCRIVEMPVAYRRRVNGRSKISGSFAGAIRAGPAILRTLFVVRFHARRGRDV